MHNHCHCEHKIKLCSHCDIVFCETCKKEWKTSLWNITTSDYSNMPFNGMNTVLCNNATSGTGGTPINNCNHK